jgi:hypothetical protein
VLTRWRSDFLEEVSGEWVGGLGRREVPHMCLFPSLLTFFTLFADAPMSIPYSQAGRRIGTLLLTLLNYSLSLWDVLLLFPRLQLALRYNSRRSRQCAVACYQLSPHALSVLTESHPLRLRGSYGHCVIPTSRPLSPHCDASRGRVLRSRD